MRLALPAIFDLPWPKAAQRALAPTILRKEYIASNPQRRGFIATSKQRNVEGRCFAVEGSSSWAARRDTGEGVKRGAVPTQPSSKSTQSAPRNNVSRLALLPLIRIAWAQHLRVWQDFWPDVTLPPGAEVTLQCRYFRSAIASRPHTRSADWEQIVPRKI